MKALTTAQLTQHHDQLTLIMFFIWIIFCIIGHKLTNDKYKKHISYFLIGFAISQEVIDYLNRFFFDIQYNVTWQADLPIQFCHFGFYFSLIGICVATSLIKLSPKYEQYLFDFAYVLGFAGALQSLLNFDDTGINNLIGAYVLNFQHSLIILNVLWLIFAYDKRFSFRGIINAFIFMNIIIIPVGIINYILDANYMFICKPPNVESVFFIGQWPQYIIWLELIYFIYVLVLLLPFMVLKLVNKNN